LLPSVTDGAQLRERSTTLSLAGPAGVADVALMHQSTSFSDGNGRTTAQGYARFPVMPRISLLYSANVLSFAKASPRYWAPERYVAHSAGAEYVVRRVLGFSFAARVLPGVAWTHERGASSSGSRGFVADTRTTALHFAGGAEASYRAQSWEIATALSYGRGRAGGYERIDGTMQLRFLP
jgi:hypothetical protein